MSSLIRFLGLFAILCQTSYKMKAACAVQMIAFILLFPLCSYHLLRLSQSLFNTNPLTESVVIAAAKVWLFSHCMPPTVTSMCCCLEASSWDISSPLSELLVTLTDTWGDLKCPSKPWKRETGYFSSSKPLSEEQRDAEGWGDTF